MPPRENQVLGQGTPASPGQAIGPVHIVTVSRSPDSQTPPSVDRCTGVEEGDIVVAAEVLPQMYDAVERAAALVTVATDNRDQQHGMTSKAAVVAREVGMPAVVAATDIRPLVREGATVRVNGDSGEIQLVGGRNSNNPHRSDRDDGHSSERDNNQRGDSGGTRGSEQDDQQSESEELTELLEQAEKEETRRK